MYKAQPKLRHKIRTQTPAPMEKIKRNVQKNWLTLFTFLGIAAKKCPTAAPEIIIISVIIVALPTSTIDKIQPDKAYQNPDELARRNTFVIEQRPDKNQGNGQKRALHNARIFIKKFQKMFYSIEKTAHSWYDK